MKASLEPFLGKFDFENVCDSDITWFFSKGCYRWLAIRPYAAFKWISLFGSVYVRWKEEISKLDNGGQWHSIRPVTQIQKLLIGNK